MILKLFTMEQQISNQEILERLNQIQIDINVIKERLPEEELMLVKKLALATEKNNLWGTEEELFAKLKK